jgi:hypothetical protein
MITVLVDPTGIANDEIRFSMRAGMRAGKNPGLQRKRICRLVMLARALYIEAAKRGEAE